MFILRQLHLVALVIMTVVKEKDGLGATKSIKRGGEVDSLAYRSKLPHKYNIVELFHVCDISYVN